MAARLTGECGEEARVPPREASDFKLRLVRLVLGVGKTLQKVSRVDNVSVGVNGVSLSKESALRGSLAASELH